MLDDKKVGFTCSTFDLLHAGHILMLEECRSLCDVLIVGLQVDPTVDRPKKNKPVQSVYERWIQLKGCKSVDQIIPYATEADLLDLLVTLPIDVRFVGQEYQNRAFTGRHLGIDIEYNTRRHSWSSSELRDRMTKKSDSILPPYVLWADGTKCHADELEEYLKFMSDDYYIVEREETK